ncbi:uncharacterized protein LOC144238402 isoform X2 [Crocuta crocuta]
MLMSLLPLLLITYAFYHLITSQEEGHPVEAGKKGPGKTHCYNYEKNLTGENHAKPENVAYPRPSSTRPGNSPVGDPVESLTLEPVLQTDIVKAGKENGSEVGGEVIWGTFPQ